MKRILWEKKLLPGVALMGLLALPALAQGYNKSFRVPADGGSLEVVHKIGSVSVNVAEGSTVTITARQADARINATQSSQGKVRIVVEGNAAIDLVINAPTGTALDLSCIKGEVTVRNMSGPIRVRNTEGDILLSGIRSTRVDVGSSDGNVSFSGDVLPGGSYSLKSFSGHVSAILPASADFRLIASSNQGGIDVSSFGMSLNKQTDKQVEGTRGEGRATVTLWTQQGTIHLKRR
jgi:DUF4097 and DUF4098 domain-containing protein YvlB